MNDRPEDNSMNELPNDPDNAELLGAYLLDAVDDIERRRLERELITNSELAIEAARLRGVVDVLAESTADEVAPAGQWARLEAAISASGSVMQTTEPSARREPRGHARCSPRRRWLWSSWSAPACSFSRAARATAMVSSPAIRWQR